MDEAWIGRPADGLCLRPVDRDEHGTATFVEATLQVPGLEARRTVVHHYATGFDDLLAFFADLERDWKGWEGPRVFASLEHDLTLAATHDGHVRLAVQLRESTVPDGWDVSAVLRLDPGEQLSQISAELRAVLAPRP